MRDFTDSVHLIGADPAIYGIIAILGFGALVAGAHALATFGLAGTLIGGWLTTKWMNTVIEERREKLKLSRLAQERGMLLLKLRGKLPDQLSFLDEDES